VHLEDELSERFLVAWRCEKCSRGMCGFLETGEPTDRVCGACYARGKKTYPLRVKRAGIIVPFECKGNMLVVHDERPPKLAIMVAERDPPLTERERKLEEGGTLRRASVR
jgi:hypothetical protein